MQVVSLSVGTLGEGEQQNRRVPYEGQFRYSSSSHVRSYLLLTTPHSNFYQIV